MSETLEIPLEEVRDWVEKETNSLIEPLRVEAQKHLEDTQDKLADLLETSQKLLEDAEKELAKGSRKTHRRAKYLQKISENFLNLIDGITIPDEISGETLNQVSEEIEKILEAINQEKTKYFRAISPYFIMSRRRFDVALKRSVDTFSNFQTFLSEDYTKAESVESVAFRIEELRQSLTELNDAEKAKEKRKHKQEVLKKEINKNQQKIQEIQTKDEVVELTQINLRIKELEEKIKQELRHLQKPFLKFQTLVNTPSYSLSPDAKSKLDEYLENPFKALGTEKEGYPLLRSILKKIDDAMEKGKLKLKQSRLKKANDQIDNILNKTALDSLHQNCREAFSKKRQLATSGAINETRSERNELQNNLKYLQRKKRILEKRDAFLEKNTQQIRTRFEEKKSELENLVAQLANKKVQIVANKSEQ
jgi:DNA repair exonuclease SbcCD ATPase subunit